jgi:hypothetical protein
MRLPLLPVLSLAALLALGSGCGAGHDAAEKELAELRAEVTRLRAGQAALTERVDGLEIDRGNYARSAASAAPGAPPAGGADHPELSVVRLSPSEGDGDADTDGPRPLIRAVGSDGSIQKGDARRAKDARSSTAKKGAPGAAPKKDAGPTVKP